jgi:hypothetical protein
MNRWHAEPDRRRNDEKGCNIFSTMGEYFSLGPRLGLIIDSAL